MQRRLLFINQHYWPDVASTGQHLTDLAEHLAAAGYDVRVLCARGRYLAGRSSLPRREVRNGVKIRRLASTGFGRGSHVGRIADYAGFYLGALTHLLLGRRYDLVVLLTTPPMLPAAGLFARALRRRRYAIWSMDLHPEAEFALGMLRRTSATGRLLAALDEWAHRRASFVVDLGRYMKERIEAKGIPPDRVFTIPVWSAADEVTPLAPAENPLRRRLGLEDAFVVMYSGNAGLAHRFEEVLEAATLLRDDPRLRFLFVGDGPRRREIEAYVRDHKLRDLIYLDYFSRDQLRESLSVGDVHLLTLRAEMAGVAVPGKLYGIMAAGRPVVVVGPARSEPAETVMEEGIGAVVDPEAGGDGAALAGVLLEYLRVPGLAASQGARARSAFLARYDRRVCCEEWESVIDGLTRERRQATSSHRPPPPV